MLLLMAAQALFAQGGEKAYQEAEKWLWYNVRPKIYNGEITPNWIGSGDSLWYRTHTRKGTEYFLVDIKHRKKSALFNPQKLTDALNKVSKKEHKPYELALANLQVINSNKITFKLDTNRFSYDLKHGVLKQLEKQPERKVDEVISPNGKKIAFIKDYNIFMKIGDKTTQLSFDGTEKNSYANNISWYFIKNESKHQPMQYEIDAHWSPNSRYLLCAKYNRKNAEKLYMYKSLPESGFRAEVFSYDRPIAGDKELTKVSYVVFDTETGKKIACDLPENATFLEYGIQWKSPTEAYLTRYYRGWQKRELIAINVADGTTRAVVSEKAETYVDPNMLTFNICQNSNDLIWSSEQDGWQHLYRYNCETGALKNQITKGEYVVRKILKVDEKHQKIYFSANGKEAGDPYFTYLYVVNFDGSGLKLLTPENAYHSCSISPNGKYIFDDYSRIDLPDNYVVRSVKRGKLVMPIAKTDVSDLVKLGWKAPERYHLKSRDNKTEIYGAIFRPFNIDKSKKYPVIDATYSGPQTIRTPKTFIKGLLNLDVSLAQIGFVVVTVDGLGSAFRSKKFHDFSYKNLGDIGAPDHIKAIKNLAKKYPYMDTDNVGIYGHSAGGYDATHALLTHPDFYKVGVSSAGNHDHRIAKAWWPELYMGYPAGKAYDEQSNFKLADKLQGKLLLVHGDMDNNVNPASSIRMAQELMKANKDCELLILPGKDHSTAYYDKYFIRKRWDFFVQHLLHKNPPKCYKIK